MRILTAVTAATIALSSTALAQQSDALRACTANETTPTDRLRSCTAAIEAGPEGPLVVIAYLRRGNVNLTARNYDRAIADFDEAIRLDPEHSQALNSRGFAYEAKGQHDRAIADYNVAITLDPRYAAALTNRGMAYRNKGRFDAAIQDFERAIALNPNNANAYFGRALSYQDKAQWDFDAYLHEGRYEDLAIRDYDQSIRLAPRAGSFNNRALLLVGRHQYDRALQDYEEALRLDPNNALYYKNRGNAYRIMGQLDRAVAEYRKVMSLKPDDSMRKQIEAIFKELGVPG
jgi:tetratricopeptide (TPR) repeat protein